MNWGNEKYFGKISYDVSWKMGDELIVKGKKNESQLLNGNFFNSVLKKQDITQVHLISPIVDNDK